MRIVSGVRPSSDTIHIGNYLGALKQWEENQHNNECVFFIADLHAITTPYEPNELQKNILNTAIAYLAIGIDPTKSIIFLQSKMQEHTELCWLLNAVCPVGDLGRMVQYKDKSKKIKNIVAGLLNYPILQAADVLAYKANVVPVGEDQLQHIELIRTIARKFNAQFGETFPEPKAQLPKIGEKIMSLQDPRKKMSKSDNEQSYIGIFDTPAQIEKKIIRAVTDTGKEIKYNPARKPGISNLLTIYSLLSGKEIKVAEKEFKGRGYGDLKKLLTTLTIVSLEPFRRKKEDLLQREDHVKEILDQGAAKARVIARETIKEVKEKMGLT